jgi:hypothetical protein
MSVLPLNEWVVRSIHDLCNVYVNSSHVTYEIGGFVQYKCGFDGDKTIRFIQTAIGGEHDADGRSFVMLPLQISSCLFHTHDSTKPFWPSQEDLLFGIPISRSSRPYDAYTNVLFTKYGVWIYNGVYSIDTDVKSYTQHIYDFQTEMNAVLWSLPDNWNVQFVVETIFEFINKCNTMGYDITFIESCNNEIEESMYKYIEYEISTRIKMYT